MINALSIDLEDWFCANNFDHIIKREDWSKYETKIVANTRRILKLLNKNKIEATFFVLGWIAERFPFLIEEIQQDGHEIATHGYFHQKITEITPMEFEQDLQLALSVTKKITDLNIIGFRAPSFTITKKTLWTIEILSRNGIKYDSSIFPIMFHPDYGIPNASLEVFSLGDNLIEFPLSCVEFLGIRIPCSGGGYFRLFPYPITKFLLKQCNREDRPAIFYLHPWEIDPHLPKLKLPLLKKFRHYNNLEKTYSRFNQLLKDFEFTSIKKVLSL